MVFLDFQKFQIQKKLYCKFENLFFFWFFPPPNNITWLTHSNMAPELFEIEYLENDFDPIEPYTVKVDIWAMGVVLFQMLCTKYPFKSQEEVIAPEKVQFENTEEFDWELLVSPEAMSLIENMLDKLEGDRYSIEDVINDKWLANDAKAITKFAEITGIPFFANGGDGDNAPEEEKENTAPNANQKTIVAFPQVGRMMNMVCYKCNKKYNAEIDLLEHMQIDHHIKLGYAQKSESKKNQKKLKN